MLKELTKEQLAKIPEYCDKWTEIGLNTDSLDFDRAKECVFKIYEQANRTRPKYIFHAQSPLSGAYMELILKIYPWETSPQAESEYRLAGKAWDFLLPQLPKKWQPERPEQTWNWISNEIAPNLTASLKGVLSGQSYGCHGHWISFYDYMLNVIGLKEEVKMVEVFIELTKHCGWWTAREDMAILQDRPSEIHFNEEKQLHNENGPAILYRDGFAIYALNGVRMPASKFKAEG